MSKKQLPVAEFLLPFQSEEFRDAWSDWVSHREFMKLPLSPVAIKRQLKKFEQWGEEKSIKAIDNSIQNNWQGIFEPQDRQEQQSDIYSGLPKQKKFWEWSNKLDLQKAYTTTKI